MLRCKVEEREFGAALRWRNINGRQSLGDLEAQTAAHISEPWNFLSEGGGGGGVILLSVLC